MMGRRRWYWGITTVLVLWVGLSGAAPVAAQTRSLYWRRWDVTIDHIDPRTNRFTVVETHDIQFTSGQFRFGFRSIPLDRVEDLVNVAVYDGGTALTPSCGEAAGTFCVRRNNHELEITYYFLRPAQNERRVFEIAYEVVGGLRTYGGGDQLDWFAIGADHSFPIQGATVTVHLPDDAIPREGIDPIASYGPPTTVTRNGSDVVFSVARSLQAGEGLEVRIQYPHQLGNRTASWQAAFDRYAVISPYLELFFGAAAVLLLVLGPLAVYYVWYTRGRDPVSGVVPEYLSEPPSDLPPAIAGTLVDEKADLQDVMATLMDLARRGYLVIEEDRQRGFLGIGSSTTFTFKRTDKAPDDLRSFERIMLQKVFQGKDERTLESMKNKFYTAIPQIQQALYKEVVRERLFRSSPQAVRNRWGGFGMALMILAVVLGVVVLGALKDTVATLICIPIALGVVALVILVAASRMPAKTAKGAEEAAKWRAFREYLRNIRRYTDVEQATDLFNEYLPYAVAFGLERAWVQTFSRVPATPIPYWYYPCYLGGPWGQGYRHGAPVVDMRNPDIRSQLARPGSSLDGLASGAFGGLNQMSDGLFGMLNNASSTLNSRPSSSSSGGFSGGFSGGGGGGDGGGAGFG